MLTGKNNAEKIWNYLVSEGLSACGAAGLMGNLYAESGLSPVNLQNTYEKKLGYTDASYTAAVDSGAYTNFDKDGAGYGIAQWTNYKRKAGLWAYAMSTDRSIGDLEMQLEWLIGELELTFPAVRAVLKSAGSVQEASDAVLLKFEMPADQSDSVKIKRAGYGQTYYNKYAGKEEKIMTEMDLRQSVVNVAVGWLGRKESNGSHKVIIDTYNAHKPLARGYAVKYTDAWCATLGSACAIVAGLTDIIPTECSCGRQIELFKAMGSWKENDAYVPKPGDYIFYDWQDNGVGDNTGAPDHVGIVEKVAGTTITVIEGNYSDSVKRRNIKVNGQYIRGYGVPKYAEKAASAVPDAVKKLVSLGVINSPDYWLKAVSDGTVKYLDALLVKSAAKITKAGTRSRTPENGIGNLVSAGVIGSPDYWLAHYNDLQSLGSLLCALGGAVK